MQQHIDPTWLDELTPEEKETLRGMWEPQREQRIKCGNFIMPIWGYDKEAELITLCLEKIAPKRNCLPVLSIGEMIELLEGKDECLNITKRIDIDEWGYEIKLRQVGYYKFTTGELVRALWEAAKEVIRGKTNGKD